MNRKTFAFAALAFAFALATPAFADPVCPAVHGRVEIVANADGDFSTKDAIVLAATGADEFAEIDTITGGTGEWANATGSLTVTGTFVNGVGHGTYYGTVCRP